MGVLLVGGAGNTTLYGHEEHSEKSMSRFFIYVIFCLYSCTSVSRADLLLPSGLAPGDKYRLAFVTRFGRNAMSATIADYNAFVTSEANQSGSIIAGLNTTWTAIASTPFDTAKANTGTDDTLTPGNDGVPIFLVDGTTKVADHYDDLWDGDIDAPINITQFGTVFHDYIFTGSNSAGGKKTFKTVSSTSATVATGLNNSTNSMWIDGNVLPPDQIASFYGLSGELTAIPEPNAWLYVILLFGIVGYSRFRR